MKRTVATQNWDSHFYRVNYFVTDLQDGYFEHDQEFAGPDKVEARRAAAYYAKTRLDMARNGEIGYFEKELGDIDDFNLGEDYLFAISLWEMQRDSEGNEFGNLLWSFEP